LALKRRRFTRAFTRQVVRELEAGKTPAQAAREYQVHPTVLVRWRKEPLQSAERAFTGHGHLYTEEARVAELERMVGQLTRENALFKKAWLRLEARGQEQASVGRIACVRAWPLPSSLLRHAQ
jgi:transposase